MIDFRIRAGKVQGEPGTFWYQKVRKDSRSNEDISKEYRSQFSGRKDEKQ